MCTRTVGQRRNVPARDLFVGYRNIVRGDSHVEDWGVEVLGPYWKLWGDW